jgi:acyl carrier protein
MPLTVNGKVDRLMLPAPDFTRLEIDEAFMPPRTPVEEALLEIWLQVLKIERVGVNDNFFDVGGHSLLATQIISRVRDVFKIDLPLLLSRVCKLRRCSQSDATDTCRSPLHNKGSGF